MVLDHGTLFSGAEFLRKYGKDPVTNKCYLSVTRDGRPIKVQRTIFSECFYTMAMSELARCTDGWIYRVLHGRNDLVLVITCNDSSILLGIFNMYIQNVTVLLTIIDNTF